MIGRRECSRSLRSRLPLFITIVDAPNMSRFKIVQKWLLGMLFVLAGANHFLMPEWYERIMPPYLPWHRELVLLSGVLEVALGVLLLLPRFTRLAAWGLIALLLAVFPANIHMALNAQQYPNFNPIALWIRLPLQFLLVAWCWSFTRHVPQEPPRSGRA